MIKIKGMHSWQSLGSREAQQDAFGFDKDRGIMVLSDGLGSGKSGAMASHVACEAVQNYLAKEAGDPDATLPFVLKNYYSLAGNVLFNALIHANRMVLKKFRDTQASQRGAASVVAGYLDGDLLALSQTGLCEAYLVRDGGVQSLVTPRSYAAMIDPFCRLPRVERLQKQIALAALGMTDTLEPEIFEYKVQSGDLIALATDGMELMDKAHQPYLEEIQAWAKSAEDLYGLTHLDGYRFLMGRSLVDNASVLLCFLE